jgi:hypothetical protein
MTDDIYFVGSKIVDRKNSKIGGKGCLPDIKKFTEDFII